MKILIYGAGNIGSLYAALLKNSRQEVSIMARDKRLADIRDHGIQLEDFVSGKQSTTRLNVVERLDADDSYDLVLVVLPKENVSEILPILAANRHTPSVMFFGNNAAGPEEMVSALGKDRVLLGFPGASGVSHGDRIRYLILSARQQPTTIGELDGSDSLRTNAIKTAFLGAGFPVAVCPNMDAWLKTHAAEMVATAGAFYMTGADTARLARSRDALVLLRQAILEGHRVLSANGIPITPKIHRIFKWIPETILFFIMRRMIESDTAIIKIGHAHQARNEIRTMANDLRSLAGRTSVPTPALERLYQCIGPDVDSAAGP